MCGAENVEPGVMAEAHRIESSVGGLIARHCAESKIRDELIRYNQLLRFDLREAECSVSHATTTT